VGHPQTAAAHPDTRGHTAAETALTQRRAPLPVWTIWLIVALLVAAAWVTAELELYTPGSDFGYYLGLVGALMMVTLLLYPLRKHFRLLHALGGLKHWFKLHMFLGVSGPILILFHSNLHLGSLNATIAFWSMVLVAGSGIFGRFVYTKIHHGLYGRHATLQERQVRLGLESGEVRSKFHFAPAVEERLKAFETYANGELSALHARAIRFLMVGVRARWVYRRSAHELTRAHGRYAVERGWDRDKLRRRVNAARRLLRSYVHSVQDVAQFRAYEKMFSAWHILHVPLVYMLVISGIVHVIAVHMY
jgi:hypothetical protein